MRESAEMYLENILILNRENKNIRSIDVAERMGFSKASVSCAMSKLKTADLIKMGADGYITLTTQGRALAEKIYERHRVITDVLISLGVDRDIADEDACKMEHDISNETFEAIKKLLNDNI